MVKSKTKKVQTAKKRTITHVMEDRSISIIENILPREWVIRKYKPDYGIDLAIEVFDKTSAKEAITLGEHFFVQAKSVREIASQKYKVYERTSVEMLNRKSENNFQEIDVIPFDIEVSELLTVQAMGAGNPVILFVVVLSEKSVYFLCLNDYIEKVLLPEDPDYASKGHKRIYIPLRNRIEKDIQTHYPLLNYSRRGKLISAFNKFNFQNHELSHLLNTHIFSDKKIGEDKDTIEVFLNFIKIIKRYDFWNNTPWWPLIKLSYQDILDCETIAEEMKSGKVRDESLEKFVRLKELRKSMPEEYSERFPINTAFSTTWNKLSTLSRVFEDLCREWFLPTYVGINFSYKFDKIKGDF